MVLVDAPADLATPESDSPNSAMDLFDQNVAGESEFEGIDQILAFNTEQAKAKQTKSPIRKSPTESRQQTNIDRTADHRAANPVLPNEQWTAESTQQRRKWLMLAAGVVSLLILATAVVLAISTNRTNQTSDRVNAVVENASINSTTEQAASNSAWKPPVEPELKSEAKNVESDVLSNVSPDNKQDIPPVSTSDSTLLSEERIVPADSGDFDTEPIASNDAKTSSESESVDAIATRPASNTSPFDPGFENLLDHETGNTGSSETSFDDLSEALENSGSTVFEINQSASVAQRRQVGVQKYFISKPDPIDPKELKRLDEPVAGVKYSGQLLTQMFAEITQITGVPISFDAGILQLRDFDFGYRIESIEATDTTFRIAIETVLAELNQQPDSREIILEYDSKTPATITVREGSAVRSELIPIPTLSSPDQESKERLGLLIQQLIAPGSWNDENQTYSLMIDGSNFSVSHHPLVLHQVSEFSRKWNIALAIRDGTTVPESLASRWQAARTSRHAKIDRVPKFEIPLQMFLTQLQQQTGVNVIIDWNALLEAGWNPNTHVASGFEEPTVGDMLDELTHSMDVGWRVINVNTFEITSKDVIAETVVLEFYSCARILAGTLNSEQLVLSVKQALQSANRNLNRARIHFAGEIQSFIVVAPESIHRQMEAIVARLEAAQK